MTATNSADLKNKKCVPCEAGVASLTKSQVEKYLKLAPQWTANSDHTMIKRKFEFKSFYKTMAFVNAVAWIANQENHHPDLEVSYNFCLVKFTTHAINGLSDNDFICAAKVDQLVCE
ncbi:MAG: 4a-hydroxytetrahydrobiopterin dehydratase [Burkholderiales bacterium]|nr:4a-hydroxytetrahydrobiopterin dehydratase [Burkholderiales bacterium]